MEKKSPRNYFLQFCRAWCWKWLEIFSYLMTVCCLRRNEFSHLTLLSSEYVSIIYDSHSREGWEYTDSKSYVSFVIWVFSDTYGYIHTDTYKHTVCHCWGALPGLGQWSLNSWCLCFFIWEDIKELCRRISLRQLLHPLSFSNSTSCQYWL